MSARGWTMAAIAALATALSAAPAAMAAGEEFHFEEAHTILDAEALSNQLFETTAGSFECSEVSVEATTEEETLTELTATLQLADCQEGEGRNLHVYPNSCDYLLTAGIASGQQHAQTHIQCEEPGDEIETKITTVFGELNCLRYPEQTPTGGGLAYTNNGEHIDVSATIEGIEYTEVGVCGDGTTANDGIYAGEITLSGTGTEENPVGISWG